MKLVDWLKKWNLDSLKLKLEFLEMELSFSDTEKDAAWELYIELITRITTQSLGDNQGDKVTALNSVFTVFGFTRECLKRHGRKCQNFAPIAITVLNQIIRPFTAKWHKVNLDNEGIPDKFDVEFRKDLLDTQTQLLHYTKLLGDIAEVKKDFTLLS